MRRSVYTFNFVTLLILTPVVLMFFSGSFDASMDTIKQHWDISIFSDLPDSDLKIWLKDGFIDVDDHWWRIFGFTYIIEDGWHFFKGMMWIFAGLTFLYTMIIMVQHEFIAAVDRECGHKIYLFILFYIFILWMVWWIGKVIFYYWWLLK